MNQNTRDTKDCLDWNTIIYKYLKVDKYQNKLGRKWIQTSFKSKNLKYHLNTMSPIPQANKIIPPMNFFLSSIFTVTWLIVIKLKNCAVGLYWLVIRLRNTPVKGMGMYLWISNHLLQNRMKSYSQFLKQDSSLGRGIKV